MLEFRPSIIATTTEELQDLIFMVKPYVDAVRLDIMDGKFVPNTTLALEDLDLVEGLRYEAHLMIDDPISQVQFLVDNKIKLAIVHAEISNDALAAIKAIKDAGIEVGLAMNPGTMTNDVHNLLSNVDMAHIMTVQPGKWGSNFLPQNLEKIVKIKKAHPNLRISVDGHMNPDTIPLAIKAGGEIFSVGSYIFKSATPEKAIEKIQAILEEYN